jgi:hypothetical protein
MNKQDSISLKKFQQKYAIIAPVFWPGTILHLG